MLTFPSPETAMLLTRGVTGQDAYGSDVYGTTGTAVVTGTFAPEGSTELVQGQITVTSTPTFYLSPDSPIPAATDQLTVRGVTYNIDGQPALLRNPFSGETPGAVLRLERVTG